MSYKHHYAMLLPVAGMIEDGPVGLSAERVAEALRALATQVEAGEIDLEGMLGRSGPIACEQEDRWVLRAADRPNIIRKAAGGWVEVDSKMIDLEDSIDGAYAAKLLAMWPSQYYENSIFTRMENIGSPPLVAEFRDDRHSKCFRLDLRDFIATGPEDMITDLARNGWSLTDNLDVLSAFTEVAEPAALAISKHINQLADGPSEISCLVLRVPDAEKATAFLRDVRPDVHAAIFSNNAPGI